MSPHFGYSPTRHYLADRQKDDNGTAQDIVVRATTTSIGAAIRLYTPAFLPTTRVSIATLVAYVHHTVFSMMLGVHRRLVSFNVEARSSTTRVI